MKLKLLKKQAAQRYAATGHSQAVTAPASAANASKVSTPADPLKEKVDGYNYQPESKTVTETVVKGDPVNGKQTDVQQVTFYRNKVSGPNVNPGSIYASDLEIGGTGTPDSIVAAYQNGKLIAAERVGKNSVWNITIGTKKKDDSGNWIYTINQNVDENYDSTGKGPVIDMYGVDPNNLALRQLSGRSTAIHSPSGYDGSVITVPVVSATLTDEEMAQLQNEQIPAVYTEWTTNPTGFSTSKSDQLGQIAALTPDQLDVPDGYTAEVETKVYQRAKATKPATPTVNAINAGDTYVTGTGTPGDIVAIYDTAGDTFLGAGMVNPDSSYYVEIPKAKSQPYETPRVYDIDPADLTNVSDLITTAVTAHDTHDQSNVTQSAPVKDPKKLAQLENGLDNIVYDGANDKGEATPSSDINTNDNVSVDGNTYRVVRHVTYLKLKSSIPDETKTNATLVVHYVDENGNVIKTATTSQGTQGDPFEVKAATINGYELTPNSPTDVKGTYEGNSYDVTFTYRQTPAQTTVTTPTPPVTPTETSTPVTPATPSTPAPATPSTPAPGTATPTPVEAETPAPTGDTTSTTSANTEKAQAASQPVTVIAARTTGSESVAPAVKQTSTQNAKVTVTLENGTNQLPQTSEQSSSLSSLIGLLLMSVAGLLGFKRKRADK